MTAKYLRLSSALLLLAACCACVNDDSNFEQLAANTLKPVDVQLDYTELTEDPDIVPTDINDPFYNDYIENDDFTRTVYITYDGTTATAEGATSRVDIDIDGAHVTVNSASTRMHYELSGTTTDGSFKIYGENKFQLTLNGVDITNPQGAAINIQCGKTCYLVLAEATVNKLADGPVTNGFYPSEVLTEDMKGALFSEGQVSVSGHGTLNITATGKHAFASDDYIRLRPGTHLNLTSTAGHGIKANDGIYINGGMHNISVRADGAKGLKCDSIVSIIGGRTCVLTAGDAKVEYDALLQANDTTGAAAIKADSLFVITGGELRALSTGAGGKGINAGRVSIAGGSVTLVTTGIKTISSPKGIKTDNTVDISGGYTYVFSTAATPIDATAGLNIADGYTTLDQRSRRIIVQY